jgi:lactam utilization protein B
MTELEIKTARLNELISNGEGLKAIESFYAEKVIMQENEEIPRFGKQACLENEKQNLKRVKTVSGKLLNQAIDFRKNVVLSEWEIICITHDDKKWKLTEVSVQQWEDGMIVREKFYYKDLVKYKNEFIFSGD